jgi:hypothetical protein
MSNFVEKYFKDLAIGAYFIYGGLRFSKVDNRNGILKTTGATPVPFSGDDLVFVAGDTDGESKTSSA